MKNKIVTLIALCLSFTMAIAEVNGFELLKNGKVATIYVSKKEKTSIVRAVYDLQSDIKKVTGIVPEIVNKIDDVNGNLIIIGTVKNKEIVKLTRHGLLKESRGLSNMYESFLLKSVKNAYKKVDNALVIDGSDALGTIYGIYEISKRIGVSPLYYWDDIVPQRKSEVVLNNVLTIPREPSVRYRGIFINDEEALIKWSKYTSKDESHGNVSPEKYKHIFEMMLRLKANTLWPGMIFAEDYFFKAKDKNGIAINPKNATDYGLYIGTSHCENMGRNNATEWYPWAKAHKNMYDAKGEPKFDYSVNPKAIEAYWQERLNEAKKFNMIYTLGIRGIEDSPFVAKNMKNPTLENKVKFLQHVIGVQRKMIKKTFGSADAVPQIFVPYEETGELYNGETRDGKEKCKGLDIPSDVMLVWTDDNHGYARQLFSKKEKAHKGGGGIYYHFQYQGGQTYEWLTTMPFPLMQEEMEKVYNSGMNKFWIVNVGDLKPCELQLQYFLGMAENFDNYKRGGNRDYLAKNFEKYFNVDNSTAHKIGDILTRFHQYTWSKKPDHMSQFWVWDWEKNSTNKNYSIFDFGDEAQCMIKKIRDLEQQAYDIYKMLDKENRPVFWHIIYYPIRSTRLMLEKTTYYRKNQLYADQGRFRSVNKYEALSRLAESKIQKDLDYYNHKLLNGKWNGIMDPYADFNLTERIYDVANIPNNLIYNKKYVEEAVNSIGSVCEGQLLPKDKVTLEFSSSDNNSRFLDIYNRGLKQMDWKISSNSNWLLCKDGEGSEIYSGKVDVEKRLWLSVDWSSLKDGKYKAIVSVAGTGGYKQDYNVVATKKTLMLKNKSFMEGNGFVSMNANHFSNEINKGASHWAEYKDFGYSSSSMFINGGKKVKDYNKSSVLEYLVCFSTTGTFYGNLYRIPTLNEGKGRTVEIGVGVDDDKPLLLTGVRQKYGKVSSNLKSFKNEKWGWQNNIFQMMERIPFEITVDKPGYHTIKVYQRDTNIGFNKIVICTNDQAIKSLKRSIIGPIESYNTFSGENKNIIADLPICTDAMSKVDGYPTLKPLNKGNFNFSMYGTVNFDGFTAISQKNVYNPNTNVYGWRSEDVLTMGYDHNENVLNAPFWRRDALRGKKTSVFSVRVEPGEYNVDLYMGETRSKTNYVYRKGKDHRMSLSVNDNQVLNDYNVVAGEKLEKSLKIHVGNDGLLKVKVSGDWIINGLIFNKL